MLSWQVLAMGSEEANVSEDVLKTYEFHVKIAEEDVRDGDATPWERVVAAFASTIRELQERVKGLETRLAESETQRMTDYDDTLLGREMREKESRGIA